MRALGRWSSIFVLALACELLPSCGSGDESSGNHASTAGASGGSAGRASGAGGSGSSGSGSGGRPAASGTGGRDGTDGSGGAAGTAAGGGGTATGGKGGAEGSSGANGGAGAGPIFGDGGPCPATDEAHIDMPFFEDFDGSAVDASVWLVAGWLEHGGQTSPERCFAQDGYLNMVFVNDSSVPDHYLSAAIQTQQEFYYGRWEARLKPSSVPGVLNSMYTIDWDDTASEESGTGTKQEIDIEFLTYSFGDDAGEVHFAVHAQGLMSWDTRPDIELDFNPSADFHVWGFDITPDHIRWFVDDQTLLTYEYSEHDVAIDAPYALKFNVWSMEQWINGPPEPDVESLYLIDWVRFTPYPCTD